MNRLKVFCITFAAVIMIQPCMIAVAKAPAGEKTSSVSEQIRHSVNELMQYTEHDSDIPESPVSNFEYCVLENTLDDSGNPVWCILAYYGNDTVVKIPEEIEGKKVYMITRDVFKENKSIEEVYLPDSVKRLDDLAFYGCTGLKKIHLGSLQTGRMSWLLHECPNLESITMSDEADFALEYGGAFGPSGSPIYYDDMLDHLKRIYIGDNMKTVAINLFWGDALEYVEIGENNPTYKSVDGIVYSSDGKRLVACGSSYLAENVIIPNEVQEVSYQAFYYCKNIRSVTVPAGVSTLNAGFSGMPNLKTIILKCDVPGKFENDISGISNISIIYPSEYANNYRDLVEKYSQISWIPDRKVKTGWRLNSEGIWNYVLFEDGLLATGWEKVNEKWYYFDGNGAMQIGWQLLNGKWYYLNASGAMQSDWQKINGKWYYFNTSGAMQSDWQKISGKWYYFNTSGAMQSGWQKISGKWYYFNANGVMQSGWQKINGKWYYFNTSGAMQSDWQKINGKWYYFDANGAMQIGWIKVENSWYYLNSSGIMQTGWLKISGTWYYLNSSGAMVTSAWVDGYYLSEDGTIL